MARNQYHDPKDAQNPDPKKSKRRNILKIEARREEENNQIVNTTIFDLAFTSDVPNHLHQSLTPETELEKLGKECLEWAKHDPNAIKIRKFFRDRDFDYDDIERFRVKSPMFSRYYEMALDAIGDRREEAAYNKKASENLVSFTMSLYDKDWKALWEKKLAAGKDNAKNTGNITVVMQPIESCPEVPEKTIQIENKEEKEHD